VDGGGRGGNVPRNAAACDTDACVGETGGRLSVVNSTTVPTAGTAKSQRRSAIFCRFSQPFHTELSDATPRALLSSTPDRVSTAIPHRSVSHFL
jgi:hypothetical protein